MPKKIKKEKLTKAEKTSRLLAIFAMISSMGLAGTLLALLRSIDGDESNSVLGVVVSALYAVYLILTLTHCIQGLYVFKKEERYGILFQAIFTGVAAFTALVNIQMALALFFSSINKSGLAAKVIGDRSLDDFMTSQTSQWRMLIFGLAVTLFIGLAAIVRFGKTTPDRD